MADTWQEQLADELLKSLDGNTTRKQLLLRAMQEQQEFDAAIAEDFDIGERNYLNANNYIAAAIRKGN